MRAAVNGKEFRSTLRAISLPRDGLPTGAFFPPPGRFEPPFGASIPRRVEDNDFAGRSRRVPTPGTLRSWRGFDGKPKADGFGDREQGGQAGITAFREGAVKALPLDARGFSDFGDALRLQAKAGRADLPYRSVAFRLPHASQSVNDSRGIRSNSRVLWVTSVRPCVIAIAAIIKSLGPIGVPARSSWARIRP